MTRNALLLFFEFIALRLRTENVELLRRIASEFLRTPPSFATVESMLKFAYPFVAITPVDREDDDAQERANTLLGRMRDRYRGREDDSFDKLHAALMKIVQLNNWFWLPEMFSDFCAGSDRSIERFVAERAKTISLLPFPPSSESRIKRENLKFEVEDTWMDVTMDSDSAKPTQGFATRRTSGVASKELVRSIITQLRETARTKPWRHVYDLSKIEYPFNARKHPDLKERFDRFWSQHAENVWRRSFWCKETGADGLDTPEYVHLKRQQRCAVMSFATNVIIPIYKKFGARFFFELDAQKIQHRWWWYRKPFIELPRVAMLDGVDRCFSYLKSQARKRFPKVPRYFMKCSRAQWTPRSSVWANIAQIAYIKVAVEQLKQSKHEVMETARGKLSDNMESEVSSSHEDDADSSLEG